MSPICCPFVDDAPLPNWSFSFCHVTVGSRCRCCGQDPSSTVSIASTFVVVALGDHTVSFAAGQTGYSALPLPILAHSIHSIFTTRLSRHTTPSAYFQIDNTCTLSTQMTGHYTYKSLISSTHANLQVSFLSKPQLQQIGLQSYSTQSVFYVQQYAICALA